VIAEPKDVAVPHMGDRVGQIGVAEAGGRRSRSAPPTPGRIRLRSTPPRRRRGSRCPVRSRCTGSPSRVGCPPDSTRSTATRLLCRDQRQSCHAILLVESGIQVRWVLA
jgi:hypothetical protein